MGKEYLVDDMKTIPFFCQESRLEYKGKVLPVLDHYNAKTCRRIAEKLFEK
jgi:hypothetical protein